MGELLQDLNEDQRKVVLATDGPVLVLAGAGSGKTRALTYRIAYMLQQKVARPDDILAMTFTNRAAGEMKERIAGLLKGRYQVPAAVGTFHSLGAKMLRAEAKHLPRSAGFSIMDSDDSERVVKLAMDKLKLSRKQHSPKQIRHRISAAKNAMISSSDMAAQASGPIDEVAASVFAVYEKQLAEHDAYDFDDLLIKPLGLLEQQAEVRQKYQQRWRYISVDEYQDTNPPQEKLLRLLVGKENNICAVGDDYQAIYSWRGASVDHILNFEKKYPKCTTIYLTQNYRSTPNVLEAANHVISQNRRQMHKELWTSRPGGEPVRVVALPSSDSEAKWVRQQIDQTKDIGLKRGDTVVLYRTNAQSRAFEEEFLRYGVPYTIVGGFRFYERREVKDALALLHWQANPKSFLSLQRVAAVLWRGVGPKTLQSWQAMAEVADGGWQEVLQKQGQGRPVMARFLSAYKSAEGRKFETVADRLSYLIDQTGYGEWVKSLPDGEARWENIEELINVTSGYVDLGQFLEEVALLTDMDTMEAEQDRVMCMTMHAAKGLEFEQVLIVGCEEGLLPHSNSVESEADVEEERRLLYVAMTRARKHLALSHVESRMTHGKVTAQVPSRFLEVLPDSVEVEKVGWAEPTRMATSNRASDFGLLGSNEDGEPFDTAQGEPVVLSVEEGDFVMHDSFGRGVVVGTRGSLVTCVFEGHGVKTIQAEKLNNAVGS